MGSAQYFRGTKGHLGANLQECGEHTQLILLVEVLTNLKEQKNFTLNHFSLSFQKGTWPQDYKCVITDRHI